MSDTTQFDAFRTEVIERLTIVEQMLRALAESIGEMKGLARAHDSAIAMAQMALIRHAAECPMIRRVELLELGAAERKAAIAATEKSIDRVAPLVKWLIVAVVLLVLFHAPQVLSLLGASKVHP